jgi:integrase
LVAPIAVGEEQLREIRNLMSVLFNHAYRYEFFERNPIHLVRQGAKRKRAPIVLTGDEIKTLVAGLDLREKILVLLAPSTGLRQSELFGLEWRDINFDERTINVTRSIVCGVVGHCKTESSQKPVPVHRLIVETLLKWREQQPYRKPEDWVFASRHNRGRKPLRGQSILRKFIRPKAQELGIQKHFGWHTFRHTYSTLEKRGTEFKVMQELLRHSSLRSTLDVYTQAITPSIQAAQDAVMLLLLSTTGNATYQAKDLDFASRQRFGRFCAGKINLNPLQIV